MNKINVQKQNPITKWVMDSLNFDNAPIGSAKWWTSLIKAIFYVVIGTLLFVIADLKFANPYYLAPGGTYGLSNVLNTIWPWKISNYCLCFNIPLLVIGFIILGPKFGVLTILSEAVGLGSMALLETWWGYEPLIHIGDFINEPLAQDGVVLKVLNAEKWFYPDYVLNTVAAGVLYGVGIGLIFRSGATSGGSDIISMIINKYTHISLGTLVIIVDCTIALTSVFINGDIRFPIYSCVLIYFEGVIIDMFVDTKVNRRICIISDKIDQVRDLICNKLDRGATMVAAKGLWNGAERTMIYTTVTKKEYKTIKYTMKEIDPKAFVTIHKDVENLGEGFEELPSQNDIDL
ncbi:MAG: YitT family protein [Bacteroidales bacterium]|nr:YitT family protein [Bacteroidales bacterium]